MKLKNKFFLTLGIFLVVGLFLVSFSPAKSFYTSVISSGKSLVSNSDKVNVNNSNVNVNVKKVNDVKKGGVGSGNVVAPLASVNVAQLESNYLVSGVIWNGTVILRASLLDSVNFSESPQNNSSGYAAVFMSGNSSLKQLYFGPYEEDNYSGMVFFRFNMVVPVGADRIKFVKNGSVLGYYNFGTNLPVVTNVKVAKISDGKYRIAWNPTNVNESSVSYNIYYSIDSVNWGLISITSQRFLEFYGSFPSGDIIIKVVASEGFNSGEGVSASFTVENNAPIAIIDSIMQDNYYILSGKNIALSGSAYDLESGSSSLFLTWSSSIDGFLGNGNDLVANLSVGTHVISFSASDGNKTGNDSVVITVSIDNRTDIILEGIYVSNDSQDGQSQTIGVYAHNTLLDAYFYLSFYDGDPSAGGVLLSQTNGSLYANEYADFEESFNNLSGGIHSIYVVVSGSDPAESNLSNNILSKDITVVYPCGGADVNRDGTVNFLDYNIVKT
ncbi:MAG: hypothetical protein WCP89_00165, partial [archaeon]